MLLATLALTLVAASPLIVTICTIAHLHLREQHPHASAGAPGPFTPPGQDLDEPLPTQQMPDPEDLLALAATGAPAGSEHLIAHPRSGQAHHRAPAAALRPAGRHSSIPVPRSPTTPATTTLDSYTPTAATDLAIDATPADRSRRHRRRSARTSDALRRTVAAAYREGDLDTLVAVAGAHPEHADTMAVLCACVPDPRAAAWMSTVWQQRLSLDPSDPLVTAAKLTATVPLILPTVDVLIRMSPTYTNIALALAAADLSIDDTTLAPVLLLEALEVGTHPDTLCVAQLLAHTLDTPPDPALELPGSPTPAWMSLTALTRAERTGERDLLEDARAHIDQAHPSIDRPSLRAALTRLEGRA